MTLRMSSLPEVVAGVGSANASKCEIPTLMQLFKHPKVSIHPSHSVMIPQLGEDEAEILGQAISSLLLLLDVTYEIQHNSFMH